MPVLERHARQHRRRSDHAGLTIAGLLRPVALGAVFAGGVAGTYARALIGDWLPHTPFPWATFVVNMVGAFILGALVESLAAQPDDKRHRRIRLLFGTGFCGGLTTYSAFALDIHNAALGMGTVYAVITIVLGLAGAVVARR